MRIFFYLIWATVLVTSCHNKQEAGVPILNLAALSAIPLEKPIDSLAKGETFIDVQLPVGARIEELSKDDLSLLKAAAYRFFGKVKLVDNQYVADIKDGKEIEVSDAVVSAYLKAISSTNAFADSLKKEGQEIQLPAITDEYRNALLK
ncbi:hypothetical protein [Sphingobacterium faecium]|jgi:hypothetical protein|uniref:hypothetical protein n=1 Tax=Sphingobacterium faecium TaxID=34087 RepID=UPI00097E993D|nr:hypothetical protein [Sphingobacterium faecium]WGQ13075.1 hypothetical protein QG727_13670 [Sphingobacterium faecium]SJN51180.1 hypothetical protein FM120_29345 [Sphingobacterium faecium PCAi_F2.5]HCU45889.1 hypothetical protein [Sphingobacterium sp.]